MGKDGRAWQEGQPPPQRRRTSTSTTGCLAIVLVIVFSVLSAVSFGGRHLYWMWIVALVLELGLLILMILYMAEHKWGLAVGLGVGFFMGLIALLGSCAVNTAGSF